MCPIGFRWHVSVRALFVFAGMPLKRTVFDALRTIDCAAIRTIAERTALFQWGTTAVTDKTTVGDGRQVFGVVRHSSCLLAYYHQSLTAAGDALFEEVWAGPLRVSVAMSTRSQASAANPASGP